MPYTVRQNPAALSNYTIGRQGATVNKIIIHHAATTDFNGIGRTFQAIGRGASAHYGVGHNGAVDQYVSEANIAWHCGNWNGNSTSVGIENVNLSGAPNWTVADDTFGTLVELVRDIADRRGLGKLVVGQNLFGHRDFSSTLCPAALYARLQDLATRANTGVSTPGATATDTNAGSGKKSADAVANEVIAGLWGDGDDRRARLAAAGYSFGIIQAIVNKKLTGIPTASKPSNEAIADQVIAGQWGNGPDRQARLNSAGYDYGTIQAIVNQRLGVANAPAKKSIDAVADEVIAGLWGNGDDRRNRLAAAGYDYNAVQAMVNRKLS